ncbi:MAG: hypothetical protein WBO36_09255, partial [Saprospiraceae bacterium]
MRRNLSLFINTILLISSATTFYGQSFEVKLSIKNYNNDTIIIGNFYGEKQIVKDTLFAERPGKFIWKEDKQPESGMYLALLKPENTFVQFLVTAHEKSFHISFDLKDLADLKFNKSNENKLFYDYM